MLHAVHYHRDAFGYDDWLDADSDGCITRKEVLKRDATSLTKVSSSCSVAGTWTSLYDNEAVDSPYVLEIDHLVALAEAWYSGANTWPHDRQVAFGNDVGYVWDLQAVTSSLNQEKGAGDPADWLPPANCCTYAKAFVAVKYRWGLSVDPAEKAAMQTELAACPSLDVLQPGVPDIHALSGT